ncbi:filamentous hemagglutinin N-terminal domain-containing protein [Sphingomonas sp. ABOLE]|nr:filamentous hemagglutinin N-terminal domain-containing protein [Sphingomonas sp. ABOLE]
MPAFLAIPHATCGGLSNRVLPAVLPPLPAAAVVDGPMLQNISISFHRVSKAVRDLDALGATRPAARAFGGDHGGMMPSGGHGVAFRGKGHAAPVNRGVDDGAARTGGARAIVGHVAASPLPEPSDAAAAARRMPFSLRERVEIMLTRRRAALADHRNAGCRLRRLLLGATILGGAVPLAAQAQTMLPGGGTVVAGQASIGAAGSTMTIRQGSDRAIIDWAHFSIGEKAGVLIENGSGATLNRVTGSAVSSIDGLLRATGSVYLVNPNGVVIGARGIVETGGSFIASTLDVPDAAFLAGGSLTFAGTSRAKVVNLGKVSALGGNVALIGAVVENQGSLSAANGTVGMIAGSKVLLRDAAHDGGGLFSVLYGDAQTGAANGGTIAAANVELRAQQGNVYALAGNSAGTINATGVRRGDGRVWLVSTAGATEVAGTIRALGEGGSAGAIETSGARLRIGASAIDAAGGTWLLDPEDLVIDSAAAAAINDTLAANTGVTLVSGVDDYGYTKDGPGDILINAGLSWNTGATLTLNAYHGIAINADIAVRGGGSLALRTNQGGTGGNVVFAPGRSITFADGQSGQSLSINDAAYTLVHSWSDLQAISGQSGNFALAHDLPSQSASAAVVAELSGALDGLGHSISNLAIRATNATNVGLIGTVNSGAAVRNLVLDTALAIDWSAKGSSNMGALAGVNYGKIENISGDVQALTGDGSNVGGLVGVNRGDIRNVTIRGDAGGNNNVGGLVGQNFGRISGAQLISPAATEGAHFVGGLVGRNEDSGSISDSFAKTPVGAILDLLTEVKQTGLSNHAGGLVGFNSGRITRSFATGAVRGSESVGGLVGENAGSGTIDRAYATGAVTAKNKNAGGLVGTNSAVQGRIDISYATGAVAADTNAGGLVGYHVYGGHMANVYATGSATAREMVGGIVGENRGQIDFGYASGKVTITSNALTAGGIAGLGNFYTNVRWNKETTGQSKPTGGSYEQPLVRGLLTTQMASAGSFEGWDLDSAGGQDKIWRIYEGATAPLLKAFLTTATVSFSGSTAASGLYDGTNQATRFSTSVRTANGQAVDPARITGTIRYSCTGGTGNCVDAGSYTVRAASGLASTQSGYDLVYADMTASLSITPRTLDVTANAATQVYGDVPTLSYLVGGDGLVQGDTLSGALSTNASATSGIGTYAIAQGTLSATSNYALRFTGADLVITPRALTVTAEDAAMVYGETMPTLTYRLGGAGLVNGDSLSGALATGANGLSNVGSYAIGQGSLSASPNYALSFVGGALSITPRALTVTAADRTMVYGETAPTLGYTLGGAGLANGDTLTGSLAPNVSTTTGVGTYAIGLGTLSAGANYTLSLLGGSIAVTPRALTIRADDRSMVYGNALPALTYALGGAGLVNGDTLSGALGTSAGVTSPVGSYAIGQGTLSGGANYALSFTGGTLSVTPRALTVTVQDRSMVYGDATPALTYSLGGAGLVNGDTLSGALATSAGATSPVGGYAIGQGTLAASANYALSFTGATLSVTPRALTVTADDRSMVYGNGTPALTYSLGGAGLVNGDTLSGALATSAGVTSAVGSYAIGQGTLTAGANYALGFTGGTLSVTPRSLTIAANDRTMVYGDALPALTYALGGAGLVNGDTLFGALATSANSASAVGTYAIGLGGLSAGSNYALSFTGATLAVTPRSLTVTANDRSMVYGDALPALTYTVGGAGLANGDTLSGALSTGAALTSAVGRYAIGQGTLAASSNYALSFVGGQMAVTPRPLTVTADARSMTYGDALPTLGYAVDSGALVNGDTLSGGLTTRATATSGAGSYAIEQGTLAASGNYALNFVGANLSITPRALTVTAGDRTMVYGDAVPGLAYAVDAAGLVHGDTLEATLRGALATTASATSPVGTYAIGLGTLSAGPNYALSFGGASLTVTPRPLSVTALDRTMVYGDAVPALAYSVGGAGLVHGDTLRGALTTSANAASPVGSYAIGQGTLTAGANYALSFVGATLGVTPRPLIIRAQDSSKVLGTTLDPSVVGFQATGLVNGDRVDGVALWSEGFGAAAPYGPDPYAIAVSNASGAGLSNYAIVYQNAPTGLVVRDPNVRPTPLSIRLTGDAAPASVWRGADGALRGERPDAPMPMRPFPGIFFKRQN